MQRTTPRLLLVLLALWLGPEVRADLGVTQLAGFAANDWQRGLWLFGGTSGTSINGGNVSLGTLTARGAYPGDVGVVACACSSTSAATDCFPGSPPTGLTEIADQTNGGTTARMSTSYVLATSANVGTTISCTGSGGSADATVGTILVVRGVDQTTQIDVMTTTASGNSTNPDAASITPITDSSILIDSCSSAVNDSSPGTVTNFATAAPGLQSNTANDTGTDQSIGMTSRVLANAGALNPAAWSAWSTAQWVCSTVALRPAR